MTGTKKPDLRSEIQEIQKQTFDLRLKDLIRLCEFGRFSPEYALKYINSGVLGFETDKKGNVVIKDGKPKPITIGHTKYFQTKADIQNPMGITQELTDFAKFGYVVEIRQILGTLRELQAISADNLAKEKDPVKRQRIVDSITKNLPVYTQYIDILNKMVKHGKVGVKTEKVLVSTD